MSFSYEANFNNPKDWIRFKLGDTDKNFYFLEDEEIEGILQVTDNLQKALLECVRGILAKLSKAIDQDIGDVSIDLSKIYENYLNLYEEIKKEARSGVLDVSAPFLEDEDEAFFKRRMR